MKLITYLLSFILLLLLFIGFSKESFPKKLLLSQIKKITLYFGKFSNRPSVSPTCTY